MHAEEENLLPYVCPIYLENRKGFLEHIGTTILLKVNPDNYFLITAGHIIDQATYGSLCIRGREDLIPLNKDFHITSTQLKGSRQDDKFDFGLAKLDKSIITEISSYNDFYPLAKVETTFDLSVPRPYTFMGFPNSKNKTRYHVKPEAHSFNTIVASAEEYKKYGIDSSRHIAVRFDSSDLVDSKNKKSNFPKPIGLSGGGVWVWYIYDPSKVGNIKVVPKLTGMIIEMTPDKKMWLAIRIYPILETIRTKFPDLSSEIPKTRDLKVNIRTVEGG